MSAPTGGAWPRRGEVYWLDFDPSTGHEMSGLHPCVIVQNDVGNQYSALTIVVAITTNLRVAALPIGVLIPAGVGGLTRDSVAHCGHLYSLDKSRLRNKLGELPADRLTEVEQALRVSLGLAP